MERQHRREPDTAEARHAAAFEAMRRALAALGVEALEIVIGESADPDVPSSPATWHARVHEPHPFTAPRTYADEWMVLGFGDASAVAPVRAAVVGTMPAGLVCTGLAIEFSEPRTTVRLPVRAEHSA